jgi:hypothetical protein
MGKVYRTCAGTTHLFEEKRPLRGELLGDASPVAGAEAIGTDAGPDMCGGSACSTTPVAVR